MTAQVNHDARAREHAAGPLAGGVLTFLMTDIEGSTRRWEVWPEPMAAALERHDHIMRAVFGAHGGHVFRTAGDAFYAAFASPAAAVEAALAAQRALAGEDFSAVDGIKVRMAVHAGPAEPRDNDYYGQGINRAARLLSIAYGGQVLVSATAADMIAGTLPDRSSLFDLGLHRLKDVSGTERIYQLVAPGLAAAFPPLRSHDARIHNLPNQVTSFVGRDAELDEIEAHLRSAQLVTLVGPGGAGKTRLAIEAGRRLVDRFRDGVWLLELAPIEEPHLLAESICSIIGVPVLGTRSATDSAVGFLRNRRALLILDNCEHLAGAAADFAEAVIAACPLVSILATSRETLKIAGERACGVSNLAYPTAVSVSAEQALDHAAVRLFVDRATATLGRFDLTDANAPAVANICSQLEGLPLAIELAVPRLRMMQPHNLAGTLREGLRDLAGGSRTALPRHKALRSLYDWSYNLLTPPEQTLLRRLSVFAGGWTLESAASVASGGLVAKRDLFEHLSSLVDKSLVAVDLRGAQPRYKLLETTRQYAFDKLREKGERGRRRKLAEFMIALYAESEDCWPTMATRAWLAKYEPDLDNLRASLEWAFGSEGDARLGVDLASHSARIWDELALLPERKRWFSTAIAHRDETTPPAVSARLWFGRTSNSAHGARAGFDAAREAAELFRALDDRRGLGESLSKAGAALLTPSTTAEATQYIAEAFDVLQPLGPSKPLADCLRSRAVAAYFVGDFAHARTLVDDSMRVARAVGDHRGEVNARIALAELEFAAGNVTAAIDETKAMISGGDHNRRQLTLGLGNLTAYLLAADRVSDAKLTAFKSLHEAEALGWRAAVVRVVEHLALIAALQRDAETAARLLGYTVAFYDGKTASREITEQVSYDRLTEALEARLSKPRLAALMAEGAMLPDAEAVKMALLV